MGTPCEGEPKNMLNARTPSSTIDRSAEKKQSKNKITYFSFFSWRRPFHPKYKQILQQKNLSFLLSRKGSPFPWSFSGQNDQSAFFAERERDTPHQKRGNEDFEQRGTQNKDRRTHNQQVHETDEIATRTGSLFLRNVAEGGHFLKIWSCGCCGLCSVVETGDHEGPLRLAEGQEVFVGDGKRAGLELGG